MNESSKDPRTGVSVDGFFSNNYSEISRWAMEIVAHDRSVSEDLIHDAYLKLLRSQRDLSIADPNAYVYVAMRNTYRSQLRSKIRLAESDSSLFESLVESHLFQDPRSAFTVSDSLVEICDIACSRRRTTLSASLVILRYFLGYSIEDLSKISNRSRTVIDTRLASFRRELASQLVGVSIRAPHVGSSSAWVNGDLFERLKEMVFCAPHGRCIPLRQLRRAYRWKSNGPDRDEMSHLSSCKECLQTANRLLKIESLEQRHPSDVLRAERLLGTVLFAAISVFSQVGMA